MSFQIVRRVLDVVILVLLVVVLLPQGWFRSEEALPKKVAAVKSNSTLIEQVRTAPDIADKLAEKKALEKQPVKAKVQSVKMVDAVVGQGMGSHEPTLTKPVKQVQTKAVEEVYLQLGMFRKMDSVQRLKSQMASHAVPQRIMNKNGVMVFYLGPITKEKAIDLLPRLAKVGIKPIWRQASQVVK